MSRHLFCGGLGYSAQALIERLAPAGWRISGSVRSAESLTRWSAGGVTAALFGAHSLRGVTDLLISAPPDAAGDPFLAQGLEPGDLQRVLYLSTTGVYGDHGGGWVDEDTPLQPSADRSRRRMLAEQAWQTFGAKHGIAVQIFRLAGIYGPGRNVLDDIRAGTARRIVRPDQWFSRIHVADIALCLGAALAQPARSAVYNVCDDEPAEPAEIVRFGCRLLGVEPPPETPYESAGLSPMAASFWADNKRVHNDRVKAELGLTWLYPTYREGLTALHQAMGS
jgi:nucleoside-diphosphate-sugar epimerase